MRARPETSSTPGGVESRSIPELPSRDAQSRARLRASGRLRGGTRHVVGARKIAKAICGVLALGAIALPGSALAQERGFELVTPPGSESSNFRFDYADPDGDWVYYSVLFGAEPLERVEDGARGDLYGANRAAAGWVGSWLTPWCKGSPLIPFDETACLPDKDPAQVLQAAPIPRGRDGSVVLQSAYGIDPEADANGSNDFYRSSASGVSLLSAGESGQTVDGVLPSGVASIGTSEDLDTVVFLTNRPLVSEDQDIGQDLYASRGGVTGGLTTGGNSGTAPSFLGDRRNAVSSDGERIFFDTIDQLLPLEDTDAGADVYMHDDAGLHLLSAGTTDPAFFNMASKSGSRAYFSTASPVVPEDTDANSDMYVVDVTNPVPQLVSADTASPVTYVRVSPDGSHAYFRTADALDSAPVDSAQKLYAFDGQDIRYVATVADFGTAAVEAFFATSDDGSTIAFSTATAALSEDTNALSDVYRWSADDGLSLLSPRRPGAEAGTANMRPQDQYNQRRTGPGITPDGSRIFFQATAALAPEDTDGTRTDVYEFGPEGLRMVSPPGNAARDAIYLSNSVDGKNVYFMSGESIASTDRDGDDGDIYNARLSDPFPMPPPPSSSVGVPSDDLGPVDAPGAPVPATTGAAGPGDAVPGARARFSLAGLSKAQRARLARGGRVLMRVRVSARGAVRLVASARLGGRARRVGGGTARAASPGVVEVPLRLGARARRALAATGSLRLTIVARFSSSPAPRSLSLRLVKRNTNSKGR